MTKSSDAWKKVARSSIHADLKNEMDIVSNCSDVLARNAKDVLAAGGGGGGGPR